MVGTGSEVSSLSRYDTIPRAAHQARNMIRNLPCVCACLLAVACQMASAFVSTQSSPAFVATASSKSTQSTQLNMLPSGDFLSTANNLLLSTIDADIQAIPDNEFGTVFVGGIMVMFGGLVSVLIVGAMLEGGDLYAGLVADSYAQGAEDEEFWKNLSEEEKIKAQEALAKLRKAKGIEVDDESPSPVVQAIREDTSEAVAAPAQAPSLDDKKEASSSKSVDMFSDYE